jgi:hypothetical protein
VPTSSKTATATFRLVVCDVDLQRRLVADHEDESPNSSSRGTKDRVSRPVPVTMKLVQYRNRLSKW